MAARYTNFCRYQIVVGDVAVQCNHPCRDEYCPQHQLRMDKIDALKDEIVDVIKKAVE